MIESEVEENISKWFPYESYRPNQMEMLKFVYNSVTENKCGIINAPVGSGKSSCICAILAATEVRPIIVAVRTVSQLDIFVRELQMIREKKNPELKFSYIVGKGKVCRVFPESGVNERCKSLKKVSKNRIKGTCGGSYQSDFGFDAANPQYCPWYVNSREVDEETGVEGNSAKIHRKAAEFCRCNVSTDEVKNFAGDVCPYEMMKLAARGSDVIIVNYQHVLNETIRKTLLSWAYGGSRDDQDMPVLLVDEAHNLGAAIEEQHSIQIDSRMLERALDEFEIPEVRESIPKDCEGIAEMLPEFLQVMVKFIEYHDAKYDKDAIFDYKGLGKGLAKIFGAPGECVDSRLYPVCESLLKYQGRVDSKPAVVSESGVMQKKDGCENLIKVLNFVRMMMSSMEDCKGNAINDKSLMKIFVKREVFSNLRLKNIDPSSDMVDLANEHQSVILMSGTLHPTDSYAKYLFGREAENVNTISLPNSFPKKNRRLISCIDITSAYKVTTQNGGENENNARILKYIKGFCELPGNLAVYFPSYYMMKNYAYKMSRAGVRRDIYMEPQNAREATRVLDDFMRLPERGKSGVMFAVSGGKWSEGIDYRGDTLVGAMVVGFPLAQWNVVTKGVIDYYVDKFGDDGNFIAYTLPALNRSQQALGRVIRTENDRGFLVLCERRFAGNMGNLPDWMQEECIELTIHDFEAQVANWKNGKQQLLGV
jgi:DNA excision repair protein ERCC-2